MRRNDRNRLLSILLVLALLLSTMSFAFAEESILPSLFNDPFENMVSLTSEEETLEITENSVSVSEAQKNEETAEQRRERYRKEAKERAEKTDRYIIKYKSDNHKNNVQGKLSSRVKSNKEIMINNGKRTKKIELIVLNEPIKPQEFAIELKAMDIGGDIEYIQPDFQLTPQETTLEVIENDLQETANSNPLQNEQMVGTIPIATHSAIVAVIDTGADLSHPLFNDCLWEDNAGNNGWNFVDDNNILYNADAAASYAHGTHVAGIIAQTALGSGTPVEIMMCKVFDDGAAYTSDVIDAIEYAYGNGAKIINMSFGGTQYNPALEEAIEETDALFITAVGNHRMDLSDTPIYPACFDLDNIISVASVNADKGFTYFSNYGTEQVDITARGREVESAYPNKEMAINSGTSMATANVTGVAAAISARNVTDIEQIKERLLNTADRYTHLENKVSNGRCVNLNNALNDTAVTETVTISVEDDFDPIGYDPTPEEQMELFASRTIQDVSVGRTHTLLLATDRTVWAFGNGGSGALGNGNNNNVSATSPTQVIGLTNVISVKAGDGYSLALKQDGTVWKWGNGWTYGGGINNILVPVQVTSLQDIGYIALGASHALAYSTLNDSLYGWGYNYEGELLLNPNDWTDMTSAPHYAEPRFLKAVGDITGIDAGDCTTAVFYLYSIHMAGDNSMKQLKHSDINAIPYNLNAGNDISVFDFDLGMNHGIGIGYYTDEILLWGDNRYGQVGSTETYVSVPYAVWQGGVGENAEKYPLAPAAGRKHSLFVGGNTLYGLGDNSKGQLLSSTTSSLSVLLEDVSYVYAGWDNTVIKHIDGRFLIFGDNSYKQIDSTANQSYNTLVRIGNYAYMTTFGTKTLQKQVTADKIYDIVVSGTNVSELEDEYILEYDSEYLEVVNLSMLTKEEAVIGQPTSAGVVIINDLWETIKFSRNINIPENRVWSGAINVIRFRAKKTGTTTITLTLGGTNI